MFKITHAKSNRHSIKSIRVEGEVLTIPKLKPGGKLVILEFSTPEHFPMKQLYNFYFKHILPFVGGMISGNRKAYEYLPASVFAFPQGKNFLDIMRGAGYSNVSQQRLTFGIASLYVGEK